MGLLSRRKQGEKPQAVPKLPREISVATQRGESVLAAAAEDGTQAWMVLTTYRLLVLGPDSTVQVDRPWHQVGTGAWDPESGTLSLTWIDSNRAVQWSMRTETGPGRIPEVFRERVSASVVRAREIKLGPQRSARVTVRMVLSTRELVDQVSWGRGSSNADQELAAEVDRARAEVRAEVGLPPV
ncbi:MAG: hypothetical protein WBG57_10235 [Ornithinimicrobium sp.]